jgi:hypothetical protein
MLLIEGRAITAMIPMTTTTMSTSVRLSADWRRREGRMMGQPREECRRQAPKSPRLAKSLELPTNLMHPKLTFFSIIINHFIQNENY